MTYLDKNKQREAARNSARKKRDRMRIFIQGLKSKPCADCMIQYPPYVMDFDHVPERGKKLFGMAAIASHGRGLEQIAKEAEKCDVVCSNCHRERSHSRKSSIRIFRTPSLDIVK